MEKNKVQEIIDAGLVTFSDIEEYIESLHSTIINNERLEMLEEVFINRPG